MANEVDRIYGDLSSAAFKGPVKAASTAALTLTGTQTVDGQALVAGDRCLVKNQADTTTNGIYIVQTTAWTRAADWDGARDAMDGSLVFSPHGSTNANKIWKAVCAAETMINIGTDSVTFSSIN